MSNPGQTWLIRHANEQAAMLTEVAAFFERLADLMDGRYLDYVEKRDEAVEECRAWARKCRGEAE